MGLKLVSSQWIKYNDTILYCILFNFFILINKYVLSVIGFKYPAVFQGWQTLVSSAYLFRLNRQISNSNFQQSYIHSLLDISLFILVIVSGSKALASVPIPLFLSIQNVPMLCYLILSLYKVPLTEFFIAITGLSSSLCLFIFKDNQVSDNGMFWLIWYCAASLIFETYFQSDDSPNKEISKNFYRNVISVGILLFWILFSEEGKSAVNFTPNEETWFLSACIASGVLCSIIHAFTPRSRFAYGNVAQVISRLLPLILSLSLFPDDHLSVLSWNLIAVNMTCALLLSISVPRLPGNVESAPVSV